MSLSAEDKERFLQALDEDEDFARRVRARLLTPELLRLPEQFAAFVLEVRAFIEATNRRLSALETDVSVLKQDVSVLKQDVSVLKQDVSVLKQDVSVLKGDGLEERVRLHPLRYLKPLFTSVAKDTDLSAERALQWAAEHGLPSEDQAQLARADVIVQGRLEADREEVYGVIEASWRAHSDDIERAVRRAALLESAGLPTVAVVVSREDPGPVVSRRAEALGAGLIVGEEGRPRAPARRAQPQVP